jgi:hypothetical protein
MQEQTEADVTDSKAGTAPEAAVRGFGIAARNSNWNPATT